MHYEVQMHLNQIYSLSKPNTIRVYSTMSQKHKIKEDNGFEKSDSIN